MAEQGPKQPQSLHRQRLTTRMELVPQQKDDKVIGSKWAYKIKEDETGAVSSYKSRLVARGDQQSSSTFSEIFAPVIKFVTLRILLAIACVMDWRNTTH